ncbi:Nuclear pore complex protein [Dirofilaria immitis]
MGSSSSIGLLLLLIFSHSYCLEWDVSNFPNPTAGDYKRCRMRTTSNICDPDEILTESQRYRLNHELHQLESRTRQDHALDFCQKKGITAAMAIVKHVRGNSDEAVREMANQILRKWTLDKQCQKSVVFVVAIDDRRFWVARDSRVPVYAQEFTQIFNSQKQFFQQGDYPQALSNIIQQTWEKALSKQGGGEVPSDDRGGIDDKGGFSPIAPSPPRVVPQPDDGKKHGGLLPHIPFWFWIVLVLIILPILCCCCCLCYCCCCRKGSSTNSPRRQGPIDIEGGGRGGPMDENGGRSRGGRSSGFNNFLGGLGGVGLGHLAGQLLGGGSKRRDVPASPGYQGGGAYPATPSQPSGGYGGGMRGNRSTTTGGKGLYPTVAVNDEGGGGGW